MSWLIATLTALAKAFSEWQKNRRWKKRQGVLDEITQIEAIKKDLDQRIQSAISGNPRPGDLISLLHIQYCDACSLLRAAHKRLQRYDGDTPK